jgi:hypothetical protein
MCNASHAFIQILRFRLHYPRIRSLFECKARKIVRHTYSLDQAFYLYVFLRLCMSVGR